MAAARDRFEAPNALWPLGHALGVIVATLVSPLWALTWAPVAGWVAARWVVGARPPHQPLRLGHLVTGIRLLGPWSWAVLTAGALLPTTTLAGRPDLLDVAQLAGPLVVVGILLAAGAAYGRFAVWHASMHARWLSAFATIFTVGESALEGAGFLELAGGGVRLRPVPAALRPRLGDRSGIEARLAQVLPGLMLDPASDASQIVLGPVDPETAARRAALASTGGLLAGEIEPPLAGHPVPTGGLVLGEEDLR